ncbi:hypothetical protein QYE76_067339 [Lolium multiflorum]|uniref:Reverse transcriptase domain-containing protein n=1 Tax=Lolium multiflorum TaxID=4521 RepID=A0AAD8WCW5_LOLMU|nr:hypothetical protein QYE76_067339 [Lolium multiflorum]
MSASDAKLVDQKNKDGADIVSWREYEALRNETRREFRAHGKGLTADIQKVTEKLDTTTETINTMQVQGTVFMEIMKNNLLLLVVVLDLVTVVVALLNLELAVSLHNRKTMVWESHAGGLMGHFGREKMLLMLADHFYWPKMRRDVDRVNMEASKRADFVRKIHVKAKELIEKKGKNNAARVNKKRKEMLFKPGDMVWVHFRKDRFPKLRKSKLLPRGAGPYKVLAKINYNAYSIDLPTDEFGVSNSFNVADLTPYDGEDLGAYEDRASIAQGEEEQLDVKLDMELDVKLDMKTSHGRAREEREACARRKICPADATPVRPPPRGRPPRPGPTGPTPGEPGANRLLRWCQPEGVLFVTPVASPARSRPVQTGPAGLPGRRPGQ